MALSSLDARRTTWVSRDGSFFLFSPGIKSLCKSLNIQLVEITETVYGSGNRVVFDIHMYGYLSSSNSPGGRSRPRGPTATRDAPLCSTHASKIYSRFSSAVLLFTRRQEDLRQLPQRHGPFPVLHRMLQPPHPYGACNLVLAPSEGQ